MYAIEYADLLNILSISCEITGFIFLLPRIKNWLNLRNMHHPKYWHETWDFLRDSMNKKIEECKSTLALLEYSLQDKEYQKFITYFERIHSLHQKHSYEELKKNEEYNEKRKYVFETLRSDHATRSFYQKHYRFENLGITLVIIGLIGQAISTLLQV